MAPLRKLIITPYFGSFPEWMDLWLADFNRTMRPQGYDLLLDTDLPSFKERVKKKLGVDCPIVRGSSKVWDYRGSLGVLYQEEIKDFDFYGCVDFDVVWGQINKWAGDEVLSELDVYSTHNAYVCGAFSLFRNSAEVNNLFRNFPLWQTKLEDPAPSGWIEQQYSRVLEISGLRYRYDISPQGNPFTDSPLLKKDNGRLFQYILKEDSDVLDWGKAWKEIGLFHFRRSKHKGWPLKQ